jgi:curved DNA-binding protein CbpA
VAFASKCVCGNMTDSYGGLCDRCVALQVLDLDMHASDAQIEASYRTMVKVWHPDRFQTDQKMRSTAEEKLKEINSAHEFLMSGDAMRSHPKSAPTPSEPEDLSVEEELPFEASDEPASEAGVETAEIRRIMRRKRKNKVWLPRFLVQAGIAVGVVAAVAFLWLIVDAILMSNQRTAGPWEQYKAELVRGLHAEGLRIWSNASDNFHGQKDEKTPATSDPAQEPAPPVGQPAANASPAPGSSTSQVSRPAVGPPHIKVGEEIKGAQPYVTSGLTPTEVLAILGSPTSSSGEKMFYNGSEIDFRNGRVSGWKLDSKSDAIRVKLWPTRAPTPGLTQFAMGSSKSDVIALQGTPTLYSDNKFGYGNSVVLFQNDRVVGWQEDPNSVHLRVAH